MSSAGAIVWLAVLVLLVACSDPPPSSAPTVTPEPGGAGIPAPTAIQAATMVPPVEPTVAPQSRWSENAVWQALDAGDELWIEHCGVASFLLGPEQTDCAVAVMREAGAGDAAIEFFEEQGFFLVHFQELGPVDYGAGAAPWFNMNRPTFQLFLNGSPDVIGAILPDEEEWKSDPNFEALGANQDLAFPFLEYSRLGETMLNPGPGVAQTTDLLIEVRTCRACELVGHVHTRYSFASDGSLAAFDVLPFAAP